MAEQDVLKPQTTSSNEMRPITIRLPPDIIEAINDATIDDGRPSASDMVRTILYRYLKANGYLLHE